ncbi:hypothetical protein CN984_11860 [Bacillus cereus]|uniref:Uncharacterized protein n=1 Tax=Bacillus cereus TaxID=1396 RepID=A0A2B9PQQ3_BACCE|nr:hypothetical protein CON44_18235 [Bacillus cereus]PGO29140.1 hypothetical protein CN984_11860 [Bacillus cereus]
MEIKKYSNKSENHYTKAFRFIKGSKVKFILSYSKSLNGKRWHDDSKKARMFGCFSSKEKMYKAKAMIIGCHKLSLLVIS